MPSSIRPIRLIAPVAASRASTRVVLPEPAGPTRTTLRMAAGEVGCGPADSCPPAADGLPDIRALLRRRRPRTGAAAGLHLSPRTGSAQPTPSAASVRRRCWLPVASALLAHALMPQEVSPADDARTLSQVLDQRLQADRASADAARRLAGHRHARRHASAWSAGRWSSSRAASCSSASSSSRCSSSPT